MHSPLYTAVCWYSCLHLRNHSGQLSATRILSLASNVGRLYSQWSYRILNIPVLSKGEAYETSSPIEDVVSCVRMGVLGVGVGVLGVGVGVLGVGVGVLGVGVGVLGVGVGVLGVGVGY